MLLAVRELRPGVAVGRFLLEREVARGGMGSVWRAREGGPEGRRVALKTVLTTKRSTQKLARLFVEEARISGSVRHPNLLEIVDAGEDDGVPFLAMEWVEGVTLRRLAERPERMPLPLLLRVCMEACDGLHAAHEARTDEGEPLHVVHRDVSPHNLLVSESGRVKVIDFGIAKARGRLSEDTTEGVLRGKVRYMAPEHAMGQALDRRADVWSLGVTLLETATGRIPYSGEHDIAALVKLVSCEPELPEESSLPAPVWSIVKRALRKNREERFASTREMGTEIETYLTASCPSRNTRRELAYLVREEMKSGDTSPKRLLAPAQSMSDKSTARIHAPRVILPSAPTRDAITAPVPPAVLEALIAEELREKPVSQHPTPVVPPEIIPALFVSTSTAVILPAEVRAEMDGASDSYSDASLVSLAPRRRRRSGFVVASLLMASALAIAVGLRGRVLVRAKPDAAAGVNVTTSLAAPPAVSDLSAIAAPGEAVGFAPPSTSASTSASVAPSPSAPASASAPNTKGKRPAPSVVRAPSKIRGYR